MTFLWSNNIILFVHEEFIEKFESTVGSGLRSIVMKIFPEGWQSLAECTGLENQQGFTPFGGSNPSPSALFYKVSQKGTIFNSPVNK